MSDRVLVTCIQMQKELHTHIARIEAAGYQVIAPEVPGQQFSASELSAHMADVVGMIAGDDQLNSEFFAASKELRVLVRWGIGMDSVDHAEAERRGVVVRNTPGVFGGEVADSAMTYVLMLARGHHLVDREVRSGNWLKHEGTSLSESVVGVVGLGDIGRSFARRALGFGARVLGYDPYVRPADVAAEIELVDLGAVLRSARFVVLTCPLVAETFHLVDEDALNLMRSDAFLINVARGPVVDERALAHALRRGAIAGAGLDVFEVEPLPRDSPLRSLPNVILGAHNGSNTREGVARASATAVDILLSELAKP